MNIFKNYHDYKSHNVDYPAYEPLEQKVLNTQEDKSKISRSEYYKEYYKKNREKIRQQQREYLRRCNGVKRTGELSGLQKQVYDYLLKQYRKGEMSARGTEIARALGVSDNSIYTAVFQLTKKGYLGKGMYGRYTILKFTEEKDQKPEQISYESIEKDADLPIGRKYLDELADNISLGLIAQNKELYEENQKLKERLKQIKEAWDKYEKDNNDILEQRRNNYFDLDSLITYE